MHEAHNVFVGDILRLAKTGQAVAGFLDAYAFMGSYLPIESCGMLPNSEAAGPGDYINTWNGNYGGYRYAMLFPMYVYQRVGPHFFNAVWAQSTNNTSNEDILGTMVRLIGKPQVQQMLVEYGMRNALLDYNEFSASLKSFLQGEWNSSAGNWFHTAVTNQNGRWTPSDSIRLPRHTGRNNIPIAVTGGASHVGVNFSPNSTGSNGSASDLRAQLVYRATDGAVVMSPPVPSGTTTVQLTKTPAQGTVILVVSNVKIGGYNAPANYGWNLSERFGYRFQVNNGSPAPATVQYF